MDLENRKVLVVPESKKRIENIKKKYNNLEMTDATAKKIGKLETTNKALTTAMLASGIVTIIDYIVPDPVIGIDEALLTTLTGTLAYAQRRVDKHINDLANTGSTRIEADEVANLSNQIINITNDVKARKNKNINADKSM